MASPSSNKLLVSLLLACAIALSAVFAGQAYADAEHAKVASASQMASSEVLELEGMTPITADKVKAGSYDIDAASSSTFFKIAHATLSVSEGAMEAAIALDSKSYTLVYMGTAEQAAAASAEDYIAFDDDAWTFTVPVSALDQEIDCAAYSKRREMWYDRKLMFYAASLPQDALLVDAPQYGDPVKRAEAEDAPAESQAVAPGADAAGAVPLDMPDGEYSIEVNMTGGSGRASVSSPTWLTVKDGHAWARLLWSSSYYDYMIVNGVRYDNETDDGSNSTFTIPITALDDEIDVIADTTAMGDPVEIEYHLTFYSDTIGDKDNIPQEAAIKVLMIAIVVIVVGGILNFIVKRRRKR